MQFIDSGISILKNQWDLKKQRIKKHPLEESLNVKLNSLSNNVTQLYYKNEGISAKRLKIIYDNNAKYDSSSFLSFYQSLIDDLQNIVDGNLS